MRSIMLLPTYSSLYSNIYMIDQNFTIKIDSEKPGYGKFSIEPLAQGYGQTLGNSLRRVLLTSLSGAAVTAVAIDGVTHQFSTITGVKEDVVEMTLNLKKIRLIIDGSESVTLKLSKKGPGEVVAGDIDVPAGVTIVNPDLVIATLADKKAVLEMMLTAKKGFGFVPTEENPETGVGTIPLDAVFSPVQRVNYRVEATRVGRMTNLDKLVMEIWTDGTIDSLEALKESARILVSYFAQLYEPKTKEKDEVAKVIPSVSDDVLKMRIEELDIPTRIVNALANGGIETIEQLLTTPRSALIKIKNLGSKSLGVVEEKLKEKGITLNV